MQQFLVRVKMEIGWFLLWFDIGSQFLREVNPDCTIDFSNRIFWCTDLRDIRLIFWRQRWNISANTAGVKFPTMVAALNIAVVKYVALRKGHAAVRTVVFQRIRLSVRISTEYHTLFRHSTAEKFTSLE